MKTQRAYEIIKSLVNDTDPITGSSIENNLIYYHSEIKSSYIKILEERNIYLKRLNQKREENLKKGLSKNHGLPWNDDLVESLKQKFNKGLSVECLAKYFERSERAIVFQLVKMGLIEDKFKNNYEVLSKSINRDCNCDINEE